MLAVARKGRRGVAAVTTSGVEPRNEAPGGGDRWAKHPAGGGVTMGRVKLLKPLRLPGCRPLDTTAASRSRPPRIASTVEFAGQRCRFPRRLR